MTAAPGITIEARPVGPGQPAYLIAEIGSNHDQDKQRAIDLIGKAAAAGADAVKFQSLSFDEIYLASHETAAFREWFRAIELPEDWYENLAEASRQAGVDFLSAPCYPASISLLEAVDIPAYKLGSPQVQGDTRTLRATARTGKPLIMSSGYCEKTDLDRAVAICREEGNEQIVLLHCVSRYPTNYSECNLRFMPALTQEYGYATGLSDHTPGGHMAVAAVALGACIIEKHVTDDRARKGPDHHFALTFDEFTRMVSEVRDLEAALGTSAWPPVLPDVEDLRRRYRYKAFAASDTKAGDLLHVAAFRSEQFDDAMSADDPRLVGARAAVDIKKNQPIMTRDINAG